VARGTCTFKQRDVTAAVKAVAAAGREVQRVEIDPSNGRIIVVVASPAADFDNLDVELKQFEAQHGEG
jgi:hypothetical protein